MVYVTFKFVLCTCNIPNSKASEALGGTKAPGTRPFHTYVHFTRTHSNGVIVPSHQQHAPYTHSTCAPLYTLTLWCCPTAAPHLAYLFPWYTGRLVISCQRHNFWSFYFFFPGSTWVWAFSLLCIFYVSVSERNKASCNERWS